MTLVLEIITDAFREADLIPITQVPTLEEQVEALRLLDRFLWSLLGNEAGDKLKSFGVGSLNVVSTNQIPAFNFSTPNYVPLNSRLIANLEAATQINLHPNPEDGSRFAVVDAAGNFDIFNLTLNGNGRKIGASLTTTLNTASLTQQWFYMADTASWSPITNLALTDQLPFPREFEDLFVLGLAFRLNPRNGVATDETSLAHFRRQRNQFRARYSQKLPRDSEQGLLHLSNNRFNTTSTEG